MNYLLSSVTSQDMTTCLNNATTYKKYKHTPFHRGVSTQTQTHCAYIFHSLTPSSFRVNVVPNNLGGQAHVIHPSHIIFLHCKAYTNTIKKAVMHTHKSQGHGRRCLIKAKENLFNTNSSTAILDQHQHYIYLAIYIYIYP